MIGGVVFVGDLSGVFKAFGASNGLLLSALPGLGPIPSAPAIAGDTVVEGTGTSSSDLCAKGLPIDETCVQAFDLTLGSLGSVAAFTPLRLSGVLHLFGR